MSEKALNNDDYKILEKYSESLFNCPYDDLSGNEQFMLINHVLHNDTTFLNHGGLYDGSIQG